MLLPKEKLDEIRKRTTIVKTLEGQALVEWAGYGDEDRAALLAHVDALDPSRANSMTFDQLKSLYEATCSVYVKVHDELVAAKEEIARLRASRDGVTEHQITIMVNRFLSWRLPENFNPDGGITFKRMFNENNPHVKPMRHEPSGTNLLDATQAREMVRHMVEGL